MRKLLIALVAGAALVAGTLVLAQPASATVCVHCPQPPPDRDCGISGKLCMIGRTFPMHRPTHRPY
jgi:hypothetical protein